MVNHSLVPRPEEEQKKGPCSSMSLINYHCFKHIFISGRVLMMPSKSHGRLCDAPAKCIIIVGLKRIS